MSSSWDSTRWYRISNRDEGLSFVGTQRVITDKTTPVQPYGAVFLRITNSSDHEQQWQLYPINSTTFVLRTREGGANAYLGTSTQFNNDTDSTETKPVMAKATELGDAALWSTGEWSETVFWLQNAGNGSAWHLNATGGFLTMSDDIKAPQTQQQFQFVQGDEINDAKYSSIDSSFPTPTSAVTTVTATGGTIVVSATSAGGGSSASNDGISNDTKAIVGAVIGGIFLIAFMLAGWMIFKRREKKKRLMEDQLLSSSPQPPQQLAESRMIYEAPYSDAQRFELPVKMPAGVSNGHMAELDSGRSRH